MSCACTALVVVLIIVLVGGHEEKPFSYSEGIAENGFWADATALDYVELFVYRSFSIPKEIHEISDGALKAEINRLVESHSPETKQVTDRTVVDGDKVNMDYVGSVDGVEFSNGSTRGKGTDVTAGSTDYIDDFLTQIIGHKPGETINVEVTFPNPYKNNPDLSGKDAVFVTTINYITEYEITDKFVEENLYEENGWKTVKAMEEDTREKLKKTAIENYVREYMATKVTFHAFPDEIVAYQEKFIVYQEKEMLDYYKEQANSYDMGLEDYLQGYVGISGKDDLIEQNRDNIIQNIKRSLTVQAVAEDAGLSVSAGDMENYFSGYSSYAEQYGMPWLRQYVLGLKVLDHIIASAVLA